MPKASKQTASEHETLEGYEGHFEHFAGGWTVGLRLSRSSWNFVGGGPIASSGR